MAGLQLNTVTPVLLPPTVTGPIFLKANEESVVQRLARKVPLAVNAQTAIPVPMDVPVADWVSEGGVKPVGSAGVGVKVMTGKKVAVLVPVSQELMMTNAAGVYDQLSNDLPTAIARGFDYAAIHGASLRNPGAGAGSGPFTDYLAATPNQQTIGASTVAQGGTYNDLWLGVQQVVNSPTLPYDFTGFAADKRLIPELARTYDTQGHPLFSANGFVGGNSAGTFSNTQSAGTLLGFDCAFGTGVSGRYYRQGDSAQTVTVNGAPTGGTFTLSLGGQTTAPIPYNATAAQVQAALQALLGGQPGAQVTNPYQVTVTGSGPYSVTIANAPSPLTGNGKSLTGGTTPSVSVAQTTTLDSGLRAIGGDWSQCAWGQGMDITIKASTQANYWDGSNWHSAFQENLVLLLAEAYYGFVVADNNAFVAYTHAAGS